MEGAELTLEMIKEASKEIRSLGIKVDKNHNAVMEKMTGNHLEFKVFKAKIDARTALISTIVGLGIALGGLLLQHRKIQRQEIQETNYEQVYIKRT